MQTKLLALLLPALVLTGCGGGTKTVVETVTAPATTPTTPPTAPTTPTTPVTTPTAPEPTPATNTVHRSFFRTPSANIGCVLASGVARCDIKERDWSPPPEPASCRKFDLDYGQGLNVGNVGIAEFVCAGDTALNPTGPVVPYGTDSQVGRFTCASREDGVTCTNTATSHGFFIARDRYRIF